jgi:uncharacterized protein (TIGR04562 family)
MRLSTADEAQAFLEAYGFDPRDPADQLELDEAYTLAQQFIRDVLLPYGNLVDIPPDMPTSYSEVLLLSSTSGHPLRDWACSFLRVSHAVAHARYTRDEEALAAARHQIFDRFSTHLQVGNDSMIVTDGEMRIPLIRCDFKPEKPWDSLVLKLLHKVDAVATEVYDHLGVRFVTPDKAYALLLLKYFRTHNVFAFANIKPSRSINTLIDLKAFRAAFEEIEESYHHGEMSFKEFTALVHQLDASPKAENADAGRNPHTSTDYQTMQFTARALVRIPTTTGHKRVFVPFEVQIMDIDSYTAIQQGAGNHAAYRQRQRDAVSRRVFPWATLGELRSSVPADGAPSGDA